MAQPKERRGLYILWTARVGQPLLDAIAWCQGQGLFFDAVNANPTPWPGGGEEPRKLRADYYVDDRAITPAAFVDLLKESSPSVPFIVDAPFIFQGGGVGPINAK